MKVWKITQEELSLSFKKQKWQRVIRKVGNYTYLYFFFILEEDNNTYILNTKTLKCASIKEINHKIIPLVFDLSINAFTHKEKEIYKSYQEYICIDNRILDSNFKQTFIETEYDRHPVILDSLSTYLAARDFQGIHIFNIASAGHSLSIKEFSYFFKKDTKNKSFGLYANDDLAAFSIIEYFDPIKEKFFIDVNRLKKEDKKARQDFLSSDSYEHYSLISDGLDGEADAYWNID